MDEPTVVVDDEKVDELRAAGRLAGARQAFLTKQVIDTLPGALSIGHVRYSTAGSKGHTAIRDVQPFFGEFAMG
ncbi:MAG: amidophosphoribosyltransferase, partial [Pseudomonadota bacterium]